MATYKIKGQRYLRKYTEQGTSPVYAASVQAQKIVDTLCEVPWTRTGVDSAQMTYHTEEIVDEDRKITGLEMNVDIRDRFDAALFCAGHSGGMHRAYANVAVYRYTMPDDAIGKTLVSLAARVTSDPYNSEGARLHVFTNSTGEIPMNCHVLRGESAAGELIEDGTTAAAVAKRTEKIVGKETYWYPTTETCTLRPVDPSTSTSNLNLKKYLFLVVALESYSTVRGNWLEGCSFIANSVEIETSAAIDGLSETDLNNLSDPEQGFVVYDGHHPTIPSGMPTGEISLTVRRDGDLLIEEDGSQAPVELAVSDVAAVCRLYGEFVQGKSSVVNSDGAYRPKGAVFAVSPVTEEHVMRESDRPTPVDVLRIDASVLVIPTVFPAGSKQIRIDHDGLSLPDGAFFSIYLAPDFMTGLKEDALRDYRLYRGEREGITLLGKITAGKLTRFDIPKHTPVGSIIIAGYVPPEICPQSFNAPVTTGSTPFNPIVTII